MPLQTACQVTDRAALQIQSDSTAGSKHQQSNGGVAFRGTHKTDAAALLSSASRARRSRHSPAEGEAGGSDRRNSLGGWRLLR